MRLSLSPLRNHSLCVISKCGKSRGGGSVRGEGSVENATDSNFGPERFKFLPKTAVLTKAKGTLERLSYYPHRVKTCILSHVHSRA